MPASFGNLEYGWSNADSVNTTEVTLNVPSGGVDDDILLIMSKASDGGRSLKSVSGLPNGTLIWQNNYEPGDDQSNFWWAKIRDVSALPSTLTYYADDKYTKMGVLHTWLKDYADPLCYPWQYTRAADYDVTSWTLSTDTASFDDTFALQFLGNGDPSPPWLVTTNLDTDGWTEKYDSTDGRIELFHKLFDDTEVTDGTTISGTASRDATQHLVLIPGQNSGARAQTENRPELIDYDVERHGYTSVNMNFTLAGIANDDLLVFFAVTTDRTLSTIPSGFTLLDSEIGSDIRLYVYYKRVTDYTTEGSYTWKTSGNNSACSSMIVLRNVIDPATQLPQSLAGTTYTSATSFDAPSITTTDDMSLIVRFGGFFDGDGISGGGGVLSFKDGAYNTNGHSLTFDCLQTAGATGTETFNQASANDCGAMTLAFAPEPAASGGFWHRPSQMEFNSLNGGLV